MTVKPDPVENAPHIPLTSLWAGRTSTYGGDDYAEMILALRRFQAALAGARPEIADIAALTATLDGWTERLAAVAVDEAHQVYSRRLDLPGRGQASWPPVRFLRLADDGFDATVTFARNFLGRGGAVHGGVVAMVFDEVAGALSNAGSRSVARTAYLRTDYRSITPLDVELTLTGKFLREEGRKRFLHVTLRDGERLCAEAEILMVALKPGQP